MTRRPPPPHRHIYVIGPPVGLQKVGLATDPKSRLATLQTACPFDLLIHLAVAVPFGEAHTVERRAHRLLARSCVRNEWFDTTPEEAIEAVRTAVSPRPAAKPSTPAEWRISRTERKPVAPPDVSPLMVAGREFRPDAAFHRPPEDLPLFEFAKPIEDEQAMIDWALDVLVKRLDHP